MLALALLTPADALSAGAFVRLPVEIPAAAVVLLLLPARARRWAAAAGGAAVGVLAVVKALDLGFGSVRRRPFDLVLDWPLLGPAVDYVKTTSGRAVAVSAVVVVIAAAVAVVVLSAVGAVRLARRTRVLRGAAGLAVVCFVLAGVRNPVGEPVIGTPALSVAVDHARQVRVSLRDGEVFAAEASVDRSADGLLTALRGVDVLVVFVESYGRTAVEHPDVAAALDAGSRRLAEAGYGARSGYLTSPTSGGGSWLAHATLLSGLWVDNQQRYDTLVAGDRLTLPSAFARSGWLSVGVMPGVTRDWPEGGFFDYDRVYASDGMAYAGPPFGFASMPDQYVLSFVERVRRSNGPVLAVVPVLSSHAPWRPLPAFVPWPSVGDGSVFHGMPHGSAAAQSIWTRPPTEVRADYARSVEYSLSTLVSYLDEHASDDLLVIALGDHQPATMVTGSTPNQDVPATVIARDPALLDHIADWGWSPGLRPAADLPPWRMDTFRDRFLTAFSPPP